MGSTTRSPVACGVDVGSTNTKVVALDPTGSVVARVVRPTPRDVHGLLIDADVLFAAIEEMVRQACGDHHAVHAVCGAGVGEDGVLVDAHLRARTPALAWFDPRRQGLFRLLRPLLARDDDLDVETDPVRTLVGWRWARAQAGDLEEGSWLALSDVAGARWSERAFLSDTLASRTAAWRSADRAWDLDRVTATLGSPDLLPPVVRTGDIVGPIRSASLAGTGVLAPDAVVVAGGHDHPVAGWGVDRMLPGAILDSMGTAEVVVTQSRQAGAMRGDHVAIAPGIRSSGTTLLRVEELARNVQWASQDPAVARQIRALLEGGVAPDPVLESGYFHPGSRGGGRPAYALDAPRSPRARASAVLGALAAAGRDAVAAVRDRAGSTAEVRAAGGWVRSPGWLDIKAEVAGYRAAPILEPEVTAVGAALLAATAIGWEPDPATALGGFSTAMLG